MTVKSALRVGLSFGLTSAVISGVLTIALADALSEALGIHVSQESQPKVSVKQVWLATLATFGAKFGFTLTFVVPLVFFPLSTAIGINIIWGLVLLGILSGLVAKKTRWLGVAHHSRTLSYWPSYFADKFSREQVNPKFLAKRS